MVRNNAKSRNVSITTPVVNVTSNDGINSPSTRTARNRRRRLARRARQQNNPQGSRLVNTSGVVLSDLQRMDSGRMTSDAAGDVGFVRSLQSTLCDIDSNTLGWYNKYLDGAGCVETGREVGDNSKIPDGLLTFSVDAQIRMVDTLPVPEIDSETDGPPGTIPLDGRTWSLTIFSYPMFRTAYIAVANTFDFELSSTIAVELANVLNNLLDYRATIDADIWTPFATTIERGWFFWIKPLPPTYDLPDPFGGKTRTLTSWRMSHKCLTIEHNAPTLIDQGFWVGGHYALDPSVVPEPTRETEMVPSAVHGALTVAVQLGVDALARYSVRIPNLPQLSVISGPASLNTLSDSLYFTTIGDTSSSGTPVTFVVPTGVALYNPFEVVFAEPGDTVTVTCATTTAGPGGIFSIQFSSSSMASTPFSVAIQAAPGTLVIGAGAQSTTVIFVDVVADMFVSRTTNTIEFPAYNPAQIAVNNPKMEQFLMKETNGAYVVHKKMRKPVFELTPASSFGPVQFTTPGYDRTRNSNDGSGILDTFDANFSTASVAIRGIAHANVPVVKLYQGWEGVTNVNTPFGQFGHSGLPRNDSVMQLVDNITVRTTGIYPANDNFLGLIAKFAANALKNILSSEATPTLLGNLAQGVINKGISYANNKLDQVGQTQRVSRRIIRSR